MTGDDENRKRIKIVRVTRRRMPTSFDSLEAAIEWNEREDERMINTGLELFREYIEALNRQTLQSLGLSDEIPIDTTTKQ